MAYDKTTTWTGLSGVDSNWSTAGDWDNGVPTMASLAVFDATGAGFDCAVDGGLNSANWLFTASASGGDKARRMKKAGIK